MERFCIRFCVGFALIISYPCYAQSIQVGSVAEDFLRRGQLSGEVDSNISFTVRPIPALTVSESILTAHDIISTAYLGGDKIRFGLLPVSIQQQYNSHHPYGWNDGLMMPAKGYQSMFSAGVFAKFHFLSIQIRPEFVYAVNNSFQEVSTVGGATDLPNRFGDKAYKKLAWGQSNIKLNLGPIAVGLSNENLWWGPGMRNSLLMSNTAPGFKHLSLNTAKPVAIGIGNIEAQIVAGKLEGSGFTAAGTPDDWRYLSAMVVSYNPKWVPGLFVGLTRSFQQYSKEERSFSDYFPLFQSFQKKNTKEDEVERDQLTSVFLRWMMAKSKAEVYFEYGLNDHSYNIRDFLLAPEHSRAYTIGFRKLVPLAKRDWDHLSISFELTHMEQSIDRIIREAGEWYTHGQVLHGYTHRGQALGAGIGPGGNFQSLNVSWYKGLKRIGIQIERYEHNGDLANSMGRGQWVDFVMGTGIDWTYKKFLLSGKLQGIESNNYQWNTGKGGTTELNVFNLTIQLGLTYRF